LTISLVTGGAGFIGSHLVNALVEKGDTVRVLDDLSTGHEENLQGLAVDLSVGDIRDAHFVRNVCDGVDRVFHLAASISVAASMNEPIHYYDVNLLGSINVLWAAAQAGVKRVILASSAAVYGKTDGLVNEEMETHPLSPYADTKLAMEGAARTFTTAYGLPTVALRFFNAYGPRQSPDSPYAAVIPLFIQAMARGQAAKIEGDGKQSRDFVFVEDIVQALLLASESKQTIGGVFNVGGGRSITILELAQTLQRILPDAPPPIHVEPRPGDVRYSEANIKKIQAALEYRPNTDLIEGLGITVQWIRSQERM
jgi:nucleoside-diphosphate-sugar epimerase